MTYKLELFLVLPKKKKKKLINIKSFKNYVFLWFTYIGLLIFLHQINSFGIEIKKLRLDETYVAKLNSN